MTRMKSSFVITMLLSAVILISCGSPSGESQEGKPDMHTSQIALDWDGVYTGTLPCADCEGIMTVININKEGTYTRATKYIGKSNAIFNERGQFEWAEDGNHIQLIGSDPTTTANQYKVVENGLIQLDIEGQTIKGDNADLYRLDKVDESALTNKRWRLVTLNDKEIVMQAKAQKMPYLVIESEEDRIIGFAGCNRFNGGYEQTNSEGIRFSKIASTKMACDYISLEAEYLQTLETVETYKIDQGQLTLMNTEGDEILVFSVMYMY